MSASPRDLLRYGAGLGVLSAAAAVAAVATTPRGAEVTAAAFVGDGQVALLRRSENRARELLELYDSTAHEPRWRAPASGRRAGAASLDERLISDAAGAVALVSARTGAGGSALGHWSEGFDLETGAQRWLATPLGERALVPLRALPVETGAGEVLVEVYREGALATHVLGRDPRSGRERWRWTRPSISTTVRGLWSSGRTLAVAAGIELFLVNAATGVELERHLTSSGPCLLDGRIWFTRGTTLVGIDGADGLSDRVDLDDGAGEPERAYELRGRCAEHAGHLVFLLDASLVALDARVLEPLWHLELDDLAPPARSEHEARQPSSAVPFSGVTTRYVPLLLELRDRPSDHSLPPVLVMVDLERGELVWTSTPREELRGASLIRAGSVHLLVTGRRPYRIAAFDGATGRLVAARRLDRAGLRPKADHVRGERLLLVERRRWSVVSARALTPPMGSGLEPLGEDCRVEMARAYGPGAGELEE